MANTQAFQSGWGLGADLAAHRRERREMLGDEERQLRVTDLYRKGAALSKLIPSLAQGSDDHRQAMSALTDIESSLNQIYHPANSPGALQKDWEFLKGLIGRRKAAAAALRKTTEQGTPAASFVMNGQQVTLPATPAYTTARVAPQGLSKPQRQRLADRRQAEQRAQLDVMAGGGLTPEQEASADVRGRTAQLEGTMQSLDAFMGPNWNPAERERTRLSLMQAALGTSGKEKYFAQIISTKDANGVEHYFRVPMQEDAEPEEINFGPGQRMIPKAAQKAQGLKYDKTTGQVVDPVTGKRYNPGDPNNPPEVQAMFDGANRMLADTRNFQTKLAGLRAASYNASRPLVSYDTWNGNAPTEVPFSEYSRQPGRYLPAGAADKAIAKENLMQDISGTSRLTREAINNLREDFPVDMQAKIALAMRAEHPDETISQLMASGALGSLSPDQQDFLIAVRQLSENAMAMRSVLGAGQGSEDVRTAIRDTLPSLLSPDRSYALRQLDAFDKTIARLHRGVPNVPLNERPFPAGGGAVPQAGAAGAGAKGARSVAQVTQYFQSHPQQAQKTFGTATPSEPQVVQYIESRGYVATHP